MAFWDFFKPSKNKLYQAVYQYWVSSGVANVMPDNFDSYIENGYSGNADVYSIINRIDNMRKQAPLILKRKLADGESERVYDHDLLRYAEKVNAQTTTDEFITQFLIFRLSLGNMFIYHPKLKTGMDKGKPTELYAMPVNDVEIIMGDWMNPVKGYRIEGSANPFFEYNEVYHSKMFDPAWNKKQSLYGMSPLRAAARIVSKQNEAEQTQLKQFENQGAPYALYRDSTDAMTNRLTDEQRAGMSKKIKKHGANSETRGLPLILKDKYGVLDLGKTITDLNIIESSKDGRKVLLNVYGMPSTLFGIENATYNNISTARKAAWTDCIQPNLKEVANALNETTINSYEPYREDGLFWTFDYSQIEELQDEMKTRVEWMKLAKWTPNEIRKATGQTPIDDPLMDQPVFATNDMFLSDLSGGMDEDKNFVDYER